MGRKKTRSRKKKSPRRWERRNRRSHGRVVARELHSPGPEWTVRVVGEEERAVWEEGLQGPMSLFEVVAVEEGRGLWVRETEPVGPWRPAPPFLRSPGASVQGASVFVEDVECSRVLEEGNLFTGRWQGGRVVMPRALRESILGCPVCSSGIACCEDGVSGRPARG